VSLSSYGITVDVPTGLDCKIYRRSPSVEGETTYPILHLSTLALGGYGASDVGGDAMFDLGATDYLAIMIELGAGNGMCDYEGAVTPLAVGDFNANTQPRNRPGGGGFQGFSTLSGRCFSTIVIVGELENTPNVLADINAALSAVTIDPGDYSETG
jgi:hypothetical protein